MPPEFPSLMPPPDPVPRRAWRFLRLRARDRLVGGGWFFCSVCGGDRRFERRTHEVQASVLGVVVAALSQEHDTVRCSACATVSELNVLDTPTSRDLANAVALAARHMLVAVMAADGEDATDAALAKAIDVARRFTDDRYDESAARCDLLLLDGSYLETVCAQAGSLLADPGRERLLFGGIEVAAADGRVTLAELDTVRRVGLALGCTPVHIYGIIEHARAAIQ